MQRKILIAFMVLAFVAGVAWQQTRGSTISVDADDAARLVGADDDGLDLDPGARPAPGTYTYRGSGSDHLDLLGGSGHEFPKEIGVVVELDPEDDCAWTQHVVFVEEHVEERMFCTDDSGVRDTGLQRTTTFLGREQTSSYECSEDALRVRTGSAVGDTWSFTCTEARGGKVEHEVRRAPDTELSVGSGKVEVVHLIVTGTQRDDSRGDERTEYWLTETGLPVRFRSKRTLVVSSPLGTMTSREDYDYTLVSTDPE